MGRDLFLTIKYSLLFLRHIIEFISLNGLNMVPEGMGDLARSHRDVSILFMDIVGESWGNTRV